MKRTVGNFLNQPNRDFPGDCETWNAVQDSVTMVAILGNIAGDKAILYGCESEQEGATRKPGYVFLRTKQYPEGEVLYWEGGAVAAGMYIKQDVMAVTAFEVNYAKAYTVRSLAPGIGEENYYWSDFKTVTTTQELAQKSTAQGAKIDELVPTAPGIVQMWAGAVARIPDNYRLCDGSALQVAEFPALYAALGNLHGGTPGSTFCLPNLKGQFVVGYNADEADYNAIAKRGGERMHILTTEEIPAHTHSLFLQNSGTRFTGGGSANQLNVGTGNTGSTGGGMAHENRPPYYVLAYIIRVK